MAWHENERPVDEALRTHPTGTMYEPNGTIRVYAWKIPMGSKSKEKSWELVLRTSRPLSADRVEKVWRDNGFKTKRD